MFTNMIYTLVNLKNKTRKKPHPGLCFSEVRALAPGPEVLGFDSLPSWGKCGRQLVNMSLTSIFLSPTPLPLSLKN